MYDLFIVVPEHFTSDCVKNQIARPSLAVSGKERWLKVCYKTSFSPQKGCWKQFSTLSFLLPKSEIHCQGQWGEVTQVTQVTNESSKSHRREGDTPKHNYPWSSCEIVVWAI